jgi:hypothetical protein
LAWPTFEKVNVLLDGVGEILRYIIFVIDRFLLALGLTSSALDAVVGVDVVGGPVGVTLNLVDRVARADLDARIATLALAGDHV